MSKGNDGLDASRVYATHNLQQGQKTDSSNGERFGSDLIYGDSQINELRDIAALEDTEVHFG